MKYCVSSRVNSATIQKADEIKFQFRDRKIIPNFFEKFPEKDMILYCTRDDEIDWDELKNYNILGRGKFVVAFATTEDVAKAKQFGYRCFYGFPITSMFELNAIANLGVDYVKIGIPLFFDMDMVRSVGIPVRVVPNVAYDDGLPRTSGIHGKWIRPEDIETIYGDYVDVVEFEGIKPDKEELLYRVYAEDHEWRRELNFIIINLNYNGNNRMIISDEIKKRLNCGQRCERGKCHTCERVFDLANPDMIREYKEKVLDKAEEPTE